MPVEPMYIPGRRRTGSSPSSTVMSLAVYSACDLVFAISRNACKTRVLQDAFSVSEWAVETPPCEAQFDRFLHTLAQLLVVDLSRQLSRQRFVLRRHLQRLDNALL